MKYFIRKWRGVEHKIIGTSEDKHTCKECKQTFNQKNFHVASAKIVGKEQLVLKRLKRTCKTCENSKRALRHTLNKDPKTPEKPTVCLHCGREDAQIVLDHDWNTKKFRNWACRNCNAKFRESTFEEYVEAGKKWYHVT